MNVKTIARLFQFAASRITSDLGYLACYHFGMALTLGNLPNTDEDWECGYNREQDINHQVNLGKRLIKEAHQLGKISKRW